MRIFLSYASHDQPAALALKAALETRDRTLRIFFAPANLSAGAFWLPSLSEAIREANAFLLLVGSSLGAWQKLEYYEALDRRTREASFPIVPIITAASAPGLPFLRQLHWIASSTPHAEPTLSTIIGALKGHSIGEAEKPWETINPYRGLLALREEDGAYFFGRDLESAQILTAVAQRRNKLIALIGNSGVGKSSLVQAGVIGALKRQRWPGREESASAADSWPSSLKASRSWAYLTMRPGENPFRALAYAFTDLWFMEHGTPRRHDWVDGWETRLQGKGRLTELLDDTQARYADILHIKPPARIVLYIDQGEELYASRVPRLITQRFSEVLAQALSDPRLLVLASQRSDYYGHLQANSTLFPLTERIDVAPLASSALKVVLTEPAKSLGAVFESEAMVGLLVDAAKDQPGALPLLADHMSELWSRMQLRGDGVIRIADRSEVVQVSSALVSRANRFLAEHRTELQTIKRLFCLRLAHVPREGEPVRRRAPRSGCTAAEWLLIEQMSGPEWRLLITSEADGIPQAEIAHEVLLREWPTLRQWLLDQREFLAWRGDVEHARRQAEILPKTKRAGALLMGRPLRLAENWLTQRPYDIGAEERDFIRESVRNYRRQTGAAIRRITFLCAAGIISTVIGILYLSQMRASLIDSRKESLVVQGEIIAAAIAATGTAGSDGIQLDPDRPLDPQTSDAPDGIEAGSDFLTNPERVAPLFRRLVTPTNTRARVYDRDGFMVLDSRNLHNGQSDAPLGRAPSYVERLYVKVRGWLSRGTLPLYVELPPDKGKSYHEVATALRGFKSAMVRLNEFGEVIVSVAIPIQRFRRVGGALMMQTQGSDIDDLLAAERLAIIKITLITLGVVVVLAFLLGSAIFSPFRN